MKLKALLLGMVLLSNGAIADEVSHPIEQRLAACIDQNGTTAGMANCALTAHEEWDTLLNSSYRELMAQLPNSSREKLRASQRAWVKYKELEETNIRSLYEDKRGSMWGLIIISDRIKITKHRAEELQSYLASLR